MAHSCPECWQVCHCGGDIDDLVFDDTDHQVRCIHYETDGCGMNLPDEEDED